MSMTRGSAKTPFLSGKRGFLIQNRVFERKIGVGGSFLPDSKTPGTARRGNICATGIGQSGGVMFHRTPIMTRIPRGVTRGTDFQI